MAYPETFDDPTVPSASTKRAAGVGVSPAAFAAEVISAIKNLQAKLGLTLLVTFTADSGTDTLTSAAHGLSNGDILVLQSSGTLPGGFTEDVPYYVVNKTTNTFQLSTSYGGSAVNFTTNGTGTLKFARMASVDKFLVGGADGRSAWTDQIANLTVNTLLTAVTALILPQGASLAPTAEGSIGWDTDDDKLKVGTGTGTKELVDTDSAQSLSSKTLVNPTIQQASADIFRPIGEVTLWPSNTPPAGWLLCDGRPVSRTVFADLFAVIGTTFGTGDGSNTFNIPDFRGRTPVGPDAGAGRISSNNTLGSAGGSQSHSHPLSSANGYAKVRPVGNQQWTDRVSASYAFNHRQDMTSAANETGTAEYGVGLGGNTDSTTDLSPYQVCNFIIRYANVPVVFADSWAPLAHIPQSNWAQRRNRGIRHMSNQLIRPTVFA